MKIKKKKISLFTFFSYLILTVAGFVMLYPIIYILLASTFTAQEFNNSVIGFFPIPENPTFDNYKALFFASSDKWTLVYFQNSIFRTIYGTFFSVLTSLLAGYVFARLRFRGKNVVFLIVLATQMIPSIVGTMPMYLQSKVMGIYDTPYIYLFLNGGAINVMGMFLVKQSIESLPISLEEAAKIDGAGTFRMIFQVIVPLIKTVLAYIAITAAIGYWNDWTVPFYYTDSRELQTIASALSRLTAFAGQEGSQINYPAILSFSLLLTVPCIVIFLIFQKWIIEGVAHAGIKE